MSKLELIFSVKTGNSKILALFFQLIFEIKSLFCRTQRPTGLLICTQTSVQTHVKYP